MSQHTNRTDASKASAKINIGFEKINYQLFVASILVVALGFVLMMGTEDIYSFTKITVAPLVVCLGFALGFVAILYKPKNKNAK